MEKIIVESITKEFDPYLIALFGSAARGELGEDSDIDIAFLTEKKIDSYQVFLLAQTMGEQLRRPVDLINLDEVSTVFQSQIVSTYRLLYCSDQKKRKLFEILVLKKYAKLNEERQIVLDRIAREGTIYGK
ncbi:nucleotidyltransferase domain-containing protein [Heliorestis acidaminivorans]|uniref:Nucleotidyltransferase domain-containing protein n=1 Tax=Heliorestis acidaminivorans TaxID=553427 RepID=A0A6I0F3R2_9FIRM|nr:nucleotidyltransferase domain-containing protein [Heliorestis acidaminivorans]KAB2951801.1 nucleotidyltransferase domain-containing protein [Heliorestis acidaminivorans]